MAEEITAFIGYSNKDRILAGKLKDAFKELGINSFLAHEKDHVGEQWRKSILDALDACRVYIPMVTGNFLKSPFAQQEAGYIYGQKTKKIIPLMFGSQKIPPALLETIQGHKITGTQLTKERLGSILLKVEPSLVINFYIESLDVSQDFRKSEEIMETLEPHYKDFTTVQVNHYYKICTTSHYVKDANKCALKLIPNFLRITGMQKKDKQKAAGFKAWETRQKNLKVKK
jgi:hypothetical protein